MDEIKDALYERGVIADLSLIYDATNSIMIQIGPRVN